MHRTTFDSFVVCESSRAAFSAAVDVAEGRAPGALFISGPTGAGKTHLLHAIAKAIGSQRADARILHIPAEDLARRLVAAIRTDDLSVFRRLLEALDAVLLDDVYAPEFTLREILHTLEALSRRGVIVVAAAVVAPPDWHDTIVEVGWPDEGARLEIARRLAAASSISVSDAALRSLARRATGNPRELQSAIARLAAESLVARL